jgi:hypothetical protein
MQHLQAFVQIIELPRTEVHLSFPYRTLCSDTEILAAVYNEQLIVDFY